MCLFVFVYIIPGIIICCAYSLIGNKLWTEDKNLQRTESETSKGIGKHVMSGRKRVAKMLIALAVLSETSGSGGLEASRARYSYAGTIECISLFVILCGSISHSK
jgi:hypothetical protein